MLKGMVHILTTIIERIGVYILVSFLSFHALELSAVVFVAYNIAQNDIFNDSITWDLKVCDDGSLVQ
jgi:hypothetical protein